MDFLYSYPSIAVWIPFNEAWGKFKTVEIAECKKAYDLTKLINAGSGGNHNRTEGCVQSLQYKIYLIRIHYFLNNL